MRWPRLRVPDRCVWAALVSGVWLWSAFHPLEWNAAAYVALIPFVWALWMDKQGRATRLSLVAGLAFWLPSLFFLTPVTWVGAGLLAGYCALYWIPVGLVWQRALARWQPDQPMVGVRLVLAGAGWWCFWEWTRSWLLTGFPWNLLGVSQYRNIALIQCAEFGGPVVVSFLLVAMNLGLALSLFSLSRSRLGLPRRAHPELYVPILLLAVAFVFGARSLRNRDASPQTLRVAVVQPNMFEKYSPEAVAASYRILNGLSRAALRTGPDLLVWPETALLEELRGSARAMDLVQALATNGVPMLIGSLDFEPGPLPAGIQYLNSSFMIRPDGTLEGQYSKRHLVMFGEYIPFAQYLPFVRKVVPIPSDIVPGQSSGVLAIPGTGLHAGILICFEDLMPYLSRQWVQEGARLLVTQTNDAWFDPYWGSRAHMAHAVFRCVENRVPMVRCANTGVSCLIDARGVVVRQLQDPVSGRVAVRGIDIFEVKIPQARVQPALASWWFPTGLAGISLLMPGLGLSGVRREGRNGTGSTAG